MIPLSVLRSYSPHPDKLDLTGLTQDEITHGIRSSKLPDYIRYKQYLTDTNEAVAQLAEMIIQFAVNLGLDPDQTLDWARKLQQALPQSEFDSWVATLLDGGPSIFMNTLSELQTTYPNGAVGVALVRETDPAKIYVWNGTAWEDFGDYQGIEIKDNSLTSVKYADKSVTADKVSFLKTGINKFNGEYKNVAILAYDETTADLVEQTDALTAIIPIIGGKTYYFAQDGGNRKRLGWHKTKPTVGSPIDYYIGDMPAGPFSETAPIDATHLIYTVSSNEGSPDIQLQITEDKSYPFFVGYDFLSISNVSQLENKLSELNILKKTSLGTLYGNKPLLKIDYNTREIIIPTGSRMFYDGIRTVLNTTTLSFEDNIDLHPMALIFLVSSSTLKLHYINGWTQMEDDAILLGIINPIRPEIYGIDIENCEINGRMYTHSQTVKLIEDKVYSYILDDITGIYEKPLNLANVSAGQSFVLEGSTVDDIYDIYDDLVARYPNYVTKTLLGNDLTGLPIFQYKFTSPDIDNQSDYPYKKLKILLTSAIHGYEQGSAWCLAQFFKDLCYNYQEKPQLEFMRWNADFVVVPIVNPWGYNNNSRKNSNGVDLNRNFPGWWSQTDPESEYYGGPSAGSELETQLLMDVIDSNTDAEWFIDYHNIASGYPLYYIYDEKASRIAFNTVKTLTRKWKEDYQNAPQDETMLGYIKTGVYASSAYYAIMEHNMQSFVFETPWQMPFASAKYDKTTIETGVEAFGNTLVTVFKSLK